MLTISFFGHRKIIEKYVRERLQDALLKIVKNNCDISFLIGSHEDFDALILSIARELRKEYKNIQITVVFTTLTILKKDSETGYAIANSFDDVHTMIYDIEEEYFKRQITVSNQRMVDESDIVICYVDMNERQSGAKMAVEYAMKKNKEIINLFKETDRPFYGMTREQIDKEWEKFKNYKITDKN